MLLIATGLGIGSVIVGVRIWRGLRISHALTVADKAEKAKDHPDG